MPHRVDYKKWSWLSFVFVGIILLSLVGVLVFTYHLSRQLVEGEFNLKKVEVQERVLSRYNEFIKYSLPGASRHHGLMDYESARSYSDTVLKKYKFISKVVFYDSQVVNFVKNRQFMLVNLSVIPKAIYQFGEGVHKDSIVLFKSSSSRMWPSYGNEDFNNISLDFLNFMAGADTTGLENSIEWKDFFLKTSSNKILFANLPKNREFKLFKHMINKSVNRPIAIDLDVMSFEVDPNKLYLEAKSLNSTFTQLYEQVLLVPLGYQDTNVKEGDLITELPLTGPFSDYKLFFQSSGDYVSKEVVRRFIPVAGLILALFLISWLVGVLIFRNFRKDRRLFKLQYDFINNLTHEFKTPVSVIKIAGNNIRKAKMLSDKDRYYYGKILEEEADKLNGLMNKFLSFTQIENKSIQIKKEKVDLSVFIENMVKSYKVKYPDFQITYSLSGPTSMDTDPVILTSIFQNLMDNAYKYSDPGNKYLNILATYKQGYMVFKFKDKGIGIPKAEHKNIFQKFYRLQNQYNQQGSVGLGLAFCKELITFMNGKIEIYSEENKGSEFVVCLPA